MPHVRDLLHVKDLLNAKEILDAKRHEVFTVAPQASVYEAVARMNQHHVGALVVVDRDAPGVIAGIFTERDVMRRVIGQLRYADLVSVGEVMTRRPVTCTPEHSLDDVARLMCERSVRHLPVVDADGRLAGMVSIADIAAWNVHKANATIDELNDYICGRT